MITQMPRYFMHLGFITYITPTAVSRNFAVAYQGAGAHSRRGPPVPVPFRTPPTSPLPVIWGTTQVAHMDAPSSRLEPSLRRFPCSHSPPPGLGAAHRGTLLGLHAI